MREDPKANICILDPRETRTGNGKRLRKEVFHNFIFKVIKSRRVRLAGHVIRMNDSENTFKILIGKSRKNRPRKTLAQMGGH